jgi:hypothetical protein
METRKIAYRQSFNLCWFQDKNVQPKQILKVKQEQKFTERLNFYTQNNTNKLPLIPKTTKHDYKSNKHLSKIDSEIKIKTVPHFHGFELWIFRT